MILPIVAYGHPTLKKVAEDIEADFPGLDELIENMFETMYASKGVGLAAPQVNKSIRLFVVDASPFEEEIEGDIELKRTFINPYIIDEWGEEWEFNEGCLSVPNVREDILRKPNIKLEYMDRDFNVIEEDFDGILARVIQHEYDHIEGKIFVERVAQIRKMMLKRKLLDISKGNINIDYKMIFPLQKKKRK